MGEKTLAQWFFFCIFGAIGWIWLWEFLLGNTLIFWLSEVFLQNSHYLPTNGGKHQKTALQSTQNLWGNTYLDAEEFDTFPMGLWLLHRLWSVSRAEPAISQESSLYVEFRSNWSRKSHNWNIKNSPWREHRKIRQIKFNSRTQ